LDEQHFHITLDTHQQVRFKIDSSTPIKLASEIFHPPYRINLSTVIVAFATFALKKMGFKLILI
jgi:hypothetical protein